MGAEREREEVTQDSETQASEEARAEARRLINEIHRPPHWDCEMGDSCTPRCGRNLYDAEDLEVIALALDRVSGQALERAATAIQDACTMCDGLGYVETVGSAHAPDCDGGCRNCPVPVQDREGCEYCGRPMAAVRALIPGGK